MMPKGSDIRSIDMEYNDDGTWQLNFRLKDKKTKGGDMQYREPVKMTARNLKEAFKKAEKFIGGKGKEVAEYFNMPEVARSVRDIVIAAIAMLVFVYATGMMFGLAAIPGVTQ
jgi:hypothetical protein